MTSAVRLNIIVEGQTEETFIRDLLIRPLADKGIYVSCRRVETSRKGAQRFRGGLVSYRKAKSDICQWLKQDRDAHVSTMFDLYGLPDDFPGVHESKRQADPYQKVTFLEDSLAYDISDPRFLPYIQLHEFEGLLFSDVEKIDKSIASMNSDSRSQLKHLSAIREKVNSPEEIDDGPSTAPSKRLIALYPGYDKVLWGPLIASSIGLPCLEQACRHFREWLKRILALAGR